MDDTNVTKRSNFKKLCEEKKGRRKEELMEEIKNIRTQTEAWKLINRFRKKRKTHNTGISKEKWREHFMKLLGGREEEVTAERKRKIVKKDEPDLTNRRNSH